jgi:hypothetical protein
LGNSIPNILASDETIFLDFSYYQGRVDRLFLNKDGAFQFKLGVPSDDPNKSKPGLVDSAIEIAEMRLSSLSPQYSAGIYKVPEV